jgi:ribosomal protein S18 acetylase RimI-like enzyme
MNPIFLHDKARIETFLRRAPYLNLYSLGDLDDFFWPYTAWYAAEEAGELQALFLLYTGGGLPVVLAIAGEEKPRLRDLLEAGMAFLPRRFDSHLSLGLAGTVSAGGYCLEPHGVYAKMALTQPGRTAGIDTRDVLQFHPADAPELETFYSAAYPGNWFDARMLETGCYFGIRVNGQIASVAGIHVYSPRYRAAALGNIATLPEFRGQGLGLRATARLCQALQASGIASIGLNVRADNVPARKVYSRLGFTPVAEYEEYMVEGCQPA